MNKFKTKSKKFALLAVAAVALAACGGSSDSSSSESTAAGRTKNAALLTVPDAPTQMGGTAGVNQVTLYWKTPVNNGGAPVTDYYVEMSTDSGVTSSKAGWSKETTLTVTGLTAGKSYDFWVSAVNSVGRGAASFAAKGIKPLASAATTVPVATTVATVPVATTVTTVPVKKLTVPDAPTQMGGTAGINQVTLYWKTPVNNGGAPVTDYYVEMSPDMGATWAKAGWSKATTFNVAGLTAGKSYDFRVSASNSVGRGATTVVKGIKSL